MAISIIFDWTCLKPWQESTEPGGVRIFTPRLILASVADISVETASVQTARRPLFRLCCDRKSTCVKHFCKQWLDSVGDTPVREHSPWNEPGSDFPEANAALYRSRRCFHWNACGGKLDCELFTYSAHQPRKNDALLGITKTSKVVFSEFKRPLKSEFHAVALGFFFCHLFVYSYLMTQITNE